MSSSLNSNVRHSSKNRNDHYKAFGSRVTERKQSSIHCITAKNSFLFNIIDSWIQIILCDQRDAQKSIHHYKQISYKTSTFNCFIRKYRWRHCWTFFCTVGGWIILLNCFCLWWFFFFGRTVIINMRITADRYLCA